MSTASTWQPAMAGGHRPSVSRAPADERTLARRAASGCAESFGRLAVQFTPRVFALLRQRGMQIADAEDATQEAFAQAWRGIRTYDPDRPFAPWLFQIAVRSAAQAYRRKRETVPISADPEMTSDVDRLLETKEDASGLWALARRELSDDQNTLLWLVYVEGLSGPDAARATGKTPIGVRVALHRARKRLEHSLSSTTMGKTS